MNFFKSFTARNAYTRHNQGNRAFEMGKKEEGLAFHKQALELYEKAFKDGMDDPNYVMAYSILLMRYDHLEKSRDVMLRLNNAQMTSDQRKQLHSNYAVLQWKMGNLDKAIEQMRIVDGSGRTAFVYTVLGQFLIEKAKETGDFAEAIRFNEEAYEYDEEDPSTLDNLGQLKLAMGERDAAIDYFQRALAEKPSQIVTCYTLAQLYFEDGKKAEALELLDRTAKGNFSTLCPVTREQIEDLKAKIRG